MDHLIDAAEQYMQQGFKVIPLDGKKPNVKGWTQTDYDAMEIGQHLARAKEPGIGVKMGPGSGIIDVEYDNEEQHKLAKSLGCGDGPHYDSKHGGHYWFAYDSALDGLGNTIQLACGEKPLIVRINSGAQSAVPPSKDKKWTTTTEAGLPRIPSLMLLRLVQSKSPVFDDLKKLPITDESDGSKRVLKAAIKCVEHDLNDDAAVFTLRQYLSTHPTPRQWTEQELLTRVKQAEARDDVVRGSRVVQCLYNLKDKDTPYSLRELIDLLPIKVMRVGKELFINQGGIHWLESSTALFAVIKQRSHVSWSKAKNCVTQSELFEGLRMLAPEYDTVQMYPHYPPMPGVYYEHGAPQPGNKLDEFIDCFNPATDLDRQLLKAATVTQFSGVRQRPMFVLTNDEGRGQGYGKTTAAEKVTSLSGGCLTFKPSELENFTKRYFSRDGRKLRCALVDNIKSDHFESSDLEQLLTTDVISGHKMFVGEARAKNVVCFFATLNGCSLGRDLAQRSVIINLAKPKHDANWLNKVNQFIEVHRMEIIGDIIELLKRDSSDLFEPSRWADWERAVLCKLENPEELQQLILERQAACDVESNEADEIEEFIAKQLDKRGFNPDTWHGLLPSTLVATWFTQATREDHSTTKLGMKMKKNPLRRLTKYASNKYGKRCYVWRGDDSDDNPDKQLLIERVAA